MNKHTNYSALPTTVLECRDVYKEYPDVGSPIKVLMGVSLLVRRGEQIAIMGRSGSGKTTLLQLLGGLDLPTTGEVWLNGRNLHSLKGDEVDRLRNRALGFIYQMHHLLPEFSALENVAMPLLIGKVAPKAALQQAAVLLDQVGLSHRIHHRPSELSGGERQRVAIARALAREPECILADEPTGNLDDEHAVQIFSLLKTLSHIKKTSLVIVTHDAALAAQMDRTLILQNGYLS